MIFVFKVNPGATKNEWVGWFGENILKVRVQGTKDKMFSTFLEFLKKDLFIPEDKITLIKQDLQKRLISLELPDVAWELFLSIIEK